MQIQRLVLVMTLLLMAALMWGMVAPTQAAPRVQPGSLIAYGQTVSGTINEDVPCVYYYFTGTTGDPVTIDMLRISGTLDGVLTLYQGDGGFQPDGIFTQAALAENDDRVGGTLDPLLEITLPASDVYTIAACRLQAEFITITTGTFNLTLNGPDGSLGPTPTPAEVLSAGVFGDGTATPTPGDAPLPDTPTGDDPPTLTTGMTASGTLSADAVQVRYALPVRLGDHITLTLTRQNGNFAPALRVTTPDETELAVASTPEQVTVLVLSFSAPVNHVALNVDVGRYGGMLDGTTGDYMLSVVITPGAGLAGVAAPTPTPAPAVVPAATLDANYLAQPCSAGDQAVGGITSTAILIDVYSAAGDSYYVDQLERTAIFRTDDDLNVVFRVQNMDRAVEMAALFCAPDGTVQDAGERTMEVGGPYMLGVDWEYGGVPWVPGQWYVEVYVDGVVEVVLAFTVQ